MIRSVRIVALIAPLAVGACAVAPPAGPSVMALPRQGEDFSRFQSQDAYCRNFAQSQIGNTTPSQAATQSAVGSAVVGTAVGAGVGAALGAAAGNVGAGAAIGGASGLLMGSAVGANNAQMSGAEMQHRYDVAYTQCMVSAGYTVQQPGYSRAYAPPPPPVVYAYPPPYYYGPEVGIEVGGGRWHRW